MRRVPPGRLTRFEGLLLSVVLAAAAILANAPPPQAVTENASLLAPPPLEGPVVRQATVNGLLAIYLVVVDDQL